MKTSKKFKIKYIYNKPNTPEEKERQEKRIAETYDILFKSVLERKIKDI
ncbi:hypothetical protein KJ980_02880 [Patescibacteria group bacterium]|nr:hypothetical protein [Patescibacteria group bacterium]MBU4016071.1 hypothetical protein [Patescibacteria group bacterium]MBU4098570.1 hypothetical protein [Patescibacteria group bacterium]